MFSLVISQKALTDIESHKKAGNHKLLAKMERLLNEMLVTPFIGLGKPEPLRHELAGLWSRRLSAEHRLVYQVTGDDVVVLRAYGHYEGSLI